MSTHTLSHSRCSSLSQEFGLQGDTWDSVQDAEQRKTVIRTQLMSRVMQKATASSSASASQLVTPLVRREAISLFFFLVL